MKLSTKILIEETAIRQRVREMAAEIVADTPGDRPLSVLAVMDGAFLFCADLIRHLPMPVYLGFVRIVSVDRGGDPAGVEIPADFPVGGADLLVVEDILDTGKTLAALRGRLETLKPTRLRIAVLLDKPARRSQEVHVDFTGFSVEDRWVVGYGLDWKGIYRNLPHISFVEGR
jgi:hypoxanthine phosphoribosyltransferase